MIGRIFETGERHREEYPIDFPTGRFWHDITLAPMRDEDGEIIAAVGIIHDITERKRMQDGLREVDELHRDIVAQIDEVILIHEEGRIVFGNPAAARFLGMDSPDEAFGKRGRDYVHPDDLALALELGELLDSASRDTPVTREISFVTTKGAVAVGEVTASWVSYKGNKALLTVIRDVTKEKAAAQRRKKLEQRLLRTQKQESLAVLAAGVAHDFNNLLMGILGNASLIRQELGGDSKSLHRLDVVERAALRASELTRQLRIFAGDDELATEKVNLCALVGEMTELLRVTIPLRVRIEHDFERSDLTVSGDPSQLRQVVMNLLVNASEAIGDRDGRIGIRIGSVDADRALLDGAITLDGLPEGRYVSLEVTDDGAGIDDAAISKIFDPFFTTKFTGRGLGLAAVLGIVRAHGGGVQVSSRPNTGAVFRVIIPEAEPELQSRFSSIPAARPSRPGRGLALVADDDGTVRDVLRATLQLSGFEVLVAEDGAEALRLFEENEGVDIAVIDVATSYVDGYEVVKKLGVKRPGLPTILLCGDGRAGAFEGIGDMARPQRCLGKPFYPGQLMALVDELCDPSSPTLEN